MEEVARELIKEYVIESAVKQKCSEERRKEIAQFIKWNEIGKFLPGIDEEVDLDNDISIYGISASDKRSRLVNMWASRNADDATYESMIIAMCKAREKAQATRVCKMLKPKTG